MRIGRPSATLAAFVVAAAVVGCSESHPAEPNGPPVECACISPATVSINVGDFIQFAVTSVPGETWHWTSSDSTRVTVDQTGRIRAVAVGDAIITALSSSNHLATATVVVSQGVVHLPVIVIDSINELPQNSPANLAALAGTIGVEFSVPLTPDVTSASLIISRASGDTSVATVTPPTSGTTWNGILRWNTADRTPGGISAFPNGNYVLRVAITESSTVNSARQPVTVANP